MILSIQPDSSKAVEIKIGFTGSMTCIAGTHLPGKPIIYLILYGGILLVIGNYSLVCMVYRDVFGLH